jgi:hypothetical protein
MKPRAQGWGLVALLAVSSVSRGEDFPVVGPRQMGMGGAGVATTRGALSTYWNPAGLAPPRGNRVDPFFELAIHASASATATEDILRQVDDLVDLVDGIDFDGLQDSFDQGTPLTPDQIDDVLRLADEIPDLRAEGTGFLANVTPGFQLRFGRFAISAMGIVNAAGLPKVDTTLLALGNNDLATLIPGNGAPNTPSGQDFAAELAQSLVDLGVNDAQRIANELAAQAENAGVDLGDQQFRDLVLDIVESTVSTQANPVNPDQFFSANQSGIDVRGIALQEYAIAYAHPFLELFSVGVAAKLLYGTTYFRPFALNRLDNFDDVLDELTSSADEESLNFAIDIGALFQPAKWVAIGVVGKYLNAPSFDFAGPGDYRIDPQVRAGVAFQPFESLTIAVDLDLLKNESEALIGYDSQMIGGGIEYAIEDIVFLRGGLSKNLAESSEQFLIHAGLGFRFFGVSIDAAGMIAPEFVEVSVDSNGKTSKVPERAGASLMIAFGIPLP